jgi:hypothetical protein
MIALSAKAVAEAILRAGKFYRPITVQMVGGSSSDLDCEAASADAKKVRGADREYLDKLETDLETMSDAEIQDYIATIDAARALALAMVIPEALRPQPHNRINFFAA